MKRLKNYAFLFYFLHSTFFIISCGDEIEGGNNYAENQKLVDTKWILQNWDYSLGDDYIGLHDETYNFYFYSMSEGVFYYGKKDIYSDQGSSKQRHVCHFKYIVNGDKIFLEYITDKYLPYTQLSLNNDILKADQLEFTKSTISYNDNQFLSTIHGTTGACSWYSDLNGKLWLVGEGAMSNYSTYENTPWAKNGRDPQSVVIVDGVTKIGSNAFAYESLTDVEMPDESLLEIGEGAFKGTLIRSIWMSQSTSLIGREAFANCKYLKDINIPKSVVSVGEYAFSGTALNELELKFGENTRVIENFAFEGGTASYLTFTEGVQKISTGAFQGEYCGVSKELVLPNSLTTLGATVFEGAFNKIVIGTGLTEIGEKAFISSAGSGNIYINQSTPPTSGENIIVERTNWSSAESQWILYVPKGCKSAYSKKSPWNKFKSIIEDDSLEGNGDDNSNDNNDFSNDSAYDENGKYSDQLQDEIDAANPRRGEVANGFSKGSGTSSDPYIISSAAELRFFSDEVRGGNIFKNKYIKLVADITINRNVLTSYGSLNGDGSDFEPWIPIGRFRPSYFFCGTFDGAGHTISGLYCNRPEGEYIGLFGKLRGNVKNLTITDSYFCGNKKVGGIVGGADNMVAECPTSFSEYYRTYPAINITSCVNEATVVSNESGVGGITGSLGKNAKISKCMNSGCIVGNNEVGGIAGIINYDNAEIISCCNESDVNGKNDVGGIAGFQTAGNIYNCLNKGCIEAAISESRNGVGGIVGHVYGAGYNSYTNYNVNITNDISDLYDHQNVGAICGYVTKLKEMKYNYCFFNQELNIVGGYLESSGISSNNRLTESEMKSSSFISTLNSKVKSGWSKWKIGADGYPVLDWMK